MKTYKEFINRYHSLKASGKEFFIKEMAYFLTQVYTKPIKITFKYLYTFDVLVLDEVNDKNIRNITYIVISRDKLSPNEASSIMNDLELRYRRLSLVCNCTIVSMEGYDTTNNNPFDLQMFGVKLDDISWFRKFFKKDEITVELVGHNQYAYENIKEDLILHDITAAIQPTGSGKSYLAAKCILDYLDKSVLLLSSSREILQQFSNNFEWMNSQNILMMTYSKLMRLSREEFNAILNNPPNLVVLDEYHRCGAKRWGFRIKELIDKVISDNKIIGIPEGLSDTKFIGFTATPVRDLDNRRDMTLELFNGNIANEMTLSEAILRKILPMPKYVIVFHSLDSDIEKLEENIEKSKRNNLEKAKLKRELNSIVRKWTESNDVSSILKKYITTERKFIIFCEDTNHIEEVMDKSIVWFKTAFGEDTKIQTYKVLYGYNKSNSELNKFLKSTAEGFHLLFNIEKLTEGMHAPGISGVILVRKTQSQIKMLQMQGRCLQTNSEQQPLILDLVNNIGNIKGTSFDEEIRKTAKKENYLRSLFNLNTISDTELEEDFIHYIYDEVQDVIDMFSRLESKVEVTWDEFYERLKEHYIQYNTCKLSSLDSEYYLYRWSIEQRRARKQGRLTQEQIDKLDAIEYDWTFRTKNHDDLYEQLVDFFNEYGHSRVKESYENTELYNYVKGRRALRARGTLPQEEIDRLDKLNFIWNVNEDEWMQGYRKMVKFYEEHNHSNPTESNADKDLVVWKGRLRKLYKNNKLSPERKALMDKLGFQWDIMGDIFEDNIAKLEEYVSIYGNANVKKSNQKYKALALWLNDMRKLKRKGTLLKEREERLTNLGVIWNVFDAKWDASLEDLIKYRKQHNTFDVKGSIDITLYRWIKKQIREFEAGTLSERKLLKLREIGFFKELGLE